MVSWEEDGREKRRGVEGEEEKLLAARERGESRERAVWVLCGRTRQGREKRKSGQSILACPGLVSLTRFLRCQLMT